MKIRRTTKHIYPLDMPLYSILRKWLGNHELYSVIETSIWISLLGFHLYRLHRYWLVQHQSYLHNPYPKGFYPEYIIPKIQWQWMDKAWLKHYSDISYKIAKIRLN
jgi:hypothetical protein